jgi:protein-S-isoprenylcysteine O-methyltransferase Ste14
MQCRLTDYSSRSRRASTATKRATPSTDTGKPSELGPLVYRRASIPAVEHAQDRPALTIDELPQARRRRWGWQSPAGFAPTVFALNRPSSTSSTLRTVGAAERIVWPERTDWPTFGSIMNPWIAKATILAASVAMVVIRAPHGRRSRGVKVARSCKGPREVALLTLAWMGFLVPLIWVVSPVFSFAEYSLRPWAFGVGVLCLVAGLWWFQRSHSDLGQYWSVTLELRENHRLITQGVYRYVRHPMYAALFLYATGQALVLPNWVVGPSYFVAFGILFAFRIRAEEKMMLETFGDEYAAYMAKTKLLVPGIW